VKVKGAGTDGTGETLMVRLVVLTSAYQVMLPNGEFGVTTHRGGTA
jgi:hypothetical protein